MPNFRVLARYAEYCDLVIKADNVAQAWEIASEIEYGEFYPLNDENGFEIASVSLTEEECDQ